MDPQVFRRCAKALVLLVVGGAVNVEHTWASCPASDLPKKSFRITDTEFRPALRSLGRQAGADASVVYVSTYEPQGMQVHPVVGTMSLCEALERMFQGSPFAFEFSSTETVWVRYVGTLGGPPTAHEGREDTQLLPVAQHSGRRPLPDNQAEITVTGSYIRGVQDIASPLVLIPQRDLQVAPYGTVQDVLRMMPFNFSGGANGLFDPQGQIGAVINQLGAETVNLHGLGVGGTLVLVDGQRRAMSGFDGNFVDVSEIPLSAIERIEVLPDGASAIYGSDAIAGVVNFIMRKDARVQSQVRLGSDQGGGRESIFSQSLGFHWDQGKATLAYEFSNRSSLPTSARSYSSNSDKVPLGGSDFRSVRSNPGNILDPSTLQPIYSIPRGADGSQLSLDQLVSNSVNLQNHLTGVDLTPNRRSQSVFWNAEHALTDAVTMFSEGLVTLSDVSQAELAPDAILAVPPSNPFNPLRESPVTLVAYNFADDFGMTVPTSQTKSYSGTIGAKAALSTTWRAALSGSFSENGTSYRLPDALDPQALDAALADKDPRTAFDPFGDGSHTNSQTIDAIRFTAVLRNLTKLRSVDFHADGRIFDTSAGQARLAFGGGYRTESLSRRAYLGDWQSETLGRTVVSTFAEIAVPLGRRAGAFELPPMWELSLAARAEKYSNFSVTASPKIGLKWSPSAQFRVRGSWSISYRAPGLVDLFDSLYDAVGLITVPTSSGYITALVDNLHDPNLREERATTWAAGIDLVPAAAAGGLQLSTTYFSIDYQNQIFHPEAPLTLQQVVSDPQWASLVTRRPRQSEVATLCNNPYFLGSVSQCLATVPDVLVTAGPRNSSDTQMRGVDFQLQQSIAGGGGRFRWSLQGTYLLSDRQRLTPSSNTSDVLNTLQNPLSFRGLAIAEWSQHEWETPGLSFRLTTAFANAYRDTSTVPSRGVGSWTTFGLSASYRMSGNLQWFGDTTWMLNVSNLFARPPPFLNREIGYDTVNAAPYARVVNLLVSKHW